MEFTLIRLLLRGQKPIAVIRNSGKSAVPKTLKQRLRLTMSVWHSKMITGNGRTFSHRMSWSWTAIIRIRKILLNG